MTVFDTNIILRFLTRDYPPKAEACRALFQRLDRGEAEATTSESVIAEVVYVLSGRTGAGYALAPEDVAGRLKPLLAVPDLKLAHKGLYRRALDLYVAYPLLDSEDALSLAHCEQRHLSSITSYDADFGKVSGIERREPTAV